MLVDVLINFCVKNQAPQVSFKNFTVGDSISVSSHEFTDVLDSDSLDILKAISDYGSRKFDLHGLMPPPLSYMITCMLPYNDTKFGDIMHSHGHFLLTSGDDFTSHGSMFKDSLS